MKIAINLTRDNVGGITISNLNLISYLYKFDYELTGLELTKQMYMKGPALFRGFAPEVFDHHIINIHHLPLTEVIENSRTLKDVEKAYKEPIVKVREILRATRPDVILLSGTNYLPWIMSIAAKQEKIPIVLWYSGILTMETSHLPDHARKIMASMEKNLIRNVAKIIFPSQLCKKTVEEMVVKGKVRKSVIIPNPVSNIFMEASAPDNRVDNKIAAVGRYYSKVKNFDCYFELHQLLMKQKWPHEAAFVTNADADLKKMPKTIKIHPSMNAEEIKKFYLSQGLLISPSTFETFGNVPMEAACLGIPVLVSDRMGCAEILKKSGLGNMVISFDDLGLVAQRVKELCGQSILPKQLNALKKNLDINTVGEEIRNIIMAVVKKKKKINALAENIKRDIGMACLIGIYLLSGFAAFGF